LRLERNGRKARALEIDPHYVDGGGEPVADLHRQDAITPIPGRHFEDVAGRKDNRNNEFA